MQPPGAFDRFVLVGKHKIMVDSRGELRQDRYKIAIHGDHLGSLFFGYVGREPDNLLFTVDMRPPQGPKLLLWPNFRGLYVGPSRVPRALGNLCDGLQNHSL
jgi:hypothetical protein